MTTKKELITVAPGSRPQPPRYLEGPFRPRPSRTVATRFRPGVLLVFALGAAPLLLMALLSS